MSEAPASTTDAQLAEVWAGVSTPLRPLLLAFQKTPFSIAPERQYELKALMETLQITGQVELEDEGLWGAASVLISRVWVGLPSMERLWAHCYGAAYVWIELEKNRFTAPIGLWRTEEGGRVGALLIWAIKRELGEKTEWPDGLPRPDGANAEGSTIELANELFRGVVAMIILHEIGHIACVHKFAPETASDIILAAEFEADEWAYEWVMGRWREFSENPKVYVKRSVIVSAFLAIIACVQFYGPKEVKALTHPNPIDRLLRFLERHADRDSGLPSVHAWYFAAAVIALHLTNCDAYDTTQKWDTSREFLHAVRHHFDKTVVGAALAADESTNL